MVISIFQPAFRPLSSPANKQVLGPFLNKMESIEWLCRNHRPKRIYRWGSNSYMAYEAAGDVKLQSKWRPRRFPSDFDSHTSCEIAILKSKPLNKSVTDVNMSSHYDEVDQTILVFDGDMICWERLKYRYTESIDCISTFRIRKIEHIMVTWSNQSKCSSIYLQSKFCTPKKIGCFTEELIGSFLNSFVAILALFSCL